MQQYDVTTSSGRTLIIEAYRAAILENDGHLSFKSFCDNNGISDYRRLLWWSRGRKISIKVIQKSSQRNSCQDKPLISSIVPIRPVAIPEQCTSLLTNVSITFPDGVNFLLQECSVENMANLLASYRSRCKAAGGM